MSSLSIQTPASCVENEPSNDLSSGIYDGLVTPRDLMAAFCKWQVDREELYAEDTCSILIEKISDQDAFLSARRRILKNVIQGFRVIKDVVWTFVATSDHEAREELKHRASEDQSDMVDLSKPENREFFLKKINESVTAFFLTAPLRLSDYKEEIFKHLKESLLADFKIDKGPILSIEAIQEIANCTSKMLKDLINGSFTKEIELILGKVEEPLQLYRVVKTYNNIPSNGIETSPEVSSLAKLDSLQLKRRIITAVREASDQIRKNLIPSMLETNEPFRSAFWRIHTALFKTDPVASHNFGASESSTITNYVKSCANAGFYQKNIGSQRSNQITNGIHFEHLDPRYLQRVQIALFGNLERIFREEQSIDQDRALDILTLTEVVLNIAHLPFDGSGRCNEEFAVYLAARLGLNLSAASTGYRHLTSPLIKDRIRVDHLAKDNFENVCLWSIGTVFTENLKPEENRIKKIGEALAKTLGWSGNDAFAVMKAHMTLRFCDALLKPNWSAMLARNLKCVNETREVWKKCLDNPYLVPPSESIAEIADDAMALHQVTGQVPKYSLAMLRAYAEKGDKFSQEIVSTIE